MLYLSFIYDTKRLIIVCTGGRVSISGKIMFSSNNFILNEYILILK